MNFMNRAWLYIIRKKGKSILLFIILLVIATFVLTALALGNASKICPGRFEEKSRRKFSDWI